MSYMSLMNTNNNDNSNSATPLMPIWLITSSRSWTVPEDGLYRLICIGKGGDGGDGFWYSRGTIKYGAIAYYESCPGASGAIAIANRELTSGTILSCVVSDTESSINSTALKATAGGDGYNMNYNYYDSKYDSHGLSLPDLPKAGIASGEWMSYGYDGNISTDIDREIHISSYSLCRFDSNSGADVGCIIFSPAINGNAGLGAFPSTIVNGTCGGAMLDTSGSVSSTDITTFPTDSRDNILPCGAHAGGGGASAGSCVVCTEISGSGSYTRPVISGSPGKGGIGAILIQRIG